MTLNNPVKSEIDSAINRALSLSPDEIAALSYEDAFYLWRNLVFVAERLELNAESANAAQAAQAAENRAKMASLSDELFYIVSDYEMKNPPKLQKPLNVFAVYSMRGVWVNPLLARDKGYTPYFLSRATGGRCVFFFAHENDPLPVAEAMPGAEFIRKNDVSPEAYEEYVKEHIDEIDILVTDNIGGNSFSLMPLFKSLKRGGGGAKSFTSLTSTAFSMIYEAKSIFSEDTAIYSNSPMHTPPLHTSDVI